MNYRLAVVLFFSFALYLIHLSNARKLKRLIGALSGEGQGQSNFAPVHPSPNDGGWHIPGLPPGNVGGEPWNVPHIPPITGPIGRMP